MPDTKTGPEKAVLSPSFCAKAAGAALAVSIALFICIYLIATLPDKITPWRTAMPTPGMTQSQTEAALLRAQYLHEAEIRPLLVQAGFLDESDIPAVDRWSRSPEATSQKLTYALWRIRMFQELHDSLLAVLLNKDRPAKDRLSDFYILGGFMAFIADNSVGRGNRNRAALSNDRDTTAWFDYFTQDPRLNIPYRDKNGYYTNRSVNDSNAAEILRYEQNLTFAAQLLPFVFKTLTKEISEQEALAATEENSPKDRSRKDRRRTAWGGWDKFNYLDSLAASAGEAVTVLAAKKDNPGFISLAKELLASDQGTLEERYKAIPLMLERPGLPVSEYFFWQSYKSGLRSISGCVGTNPGSYAFLLGCCENVCDDITVMLKERGSMILGGQQGPGVHLSRTEEFSPARNLTGNLYMLADMTHALKDAPEYDIARAIPVFQGTLLRYLENPPLLLPLNPKNASDAKLIEWYANAGWKRGRTVLFSAVGSPAEVARHWASIHLLWWPSSKKNADPDLAYMHPESGHFWYGMLPELKGQGATRFLGPITGMWFGRRTVDADGWVDEKYEARPEGRPSLATTRLVPSSPVIKRTGDKSKRPYSELTATIVLGTETRAALNRSYRHNYRIGQAISLNTQFPRKDTPPLAVFTFVDKTVTRLDDWGITQGKQVRPSLELLWRFQDHPEIEKRLVGILSDKDLRPYERLRKAHRVLGLTAPKN